MPVLSLQPPRQQRSANLRSLGARLRARLEGIAPQGRSPPGARRDRLAELDAARAQVDARIADLVADSDGFRALPLGQRARACDALSRALRTSYELAAERERLTPTAPTEPEPEFDPFSPDGREALIDELAKFPTELLLAALACTPEWLARLREWGWTPEQHGLIVAADGRVEVGY